MTRSAFRLGQGIGGLVALAVVIVACSWTTFLRATADEEDRDLVVWSYDRDAARGEQLDGRAWVDGRDVRGVMVSSGGTRVGGALVVDGHPEDTLDFAFRIPDLAAPGDTLDLRVDVFTSAGTYPVTRRLRVVSRTASALRRIGKGALAMVLLGALAAVVFVVKRRALHRGHDENPLWLAPVVLLGGIAFVPLAEQAARWHGAWFYTVALAGWAACAFAIADRLNRRIGLVRYTAVPMLVELEAHDAFRGATMRAPIRPVAELANAWSAIGLVVRRAGRELIITGPGGRIAVLRVPTSQLVGGGPLRLRASDPDFAELLVAAASNVLGELRFE